MKYRCTILLVSLFLSPHCLAAEVQELPQEWKAELAKTLGAANRIVATRVTEGGEAEKIWQIEGREQIDSFLATLQIDDSRSGVVDGCDGDPHLHFYAADKKIAVLSWHHGKSIRWRNGNWRGDGWMTERALRELPVWFADRGFDLLQTMRDKAIARERERAEQSRQFASFFPEDARAILLGRKPVSALKFKAADEAAGKQIAAAMDNPTELAVACCRALGVTRTTWTSTGPMERRVLAAARTVDGESFLRALQQLERGDESRRGLLGAARLFFRERFDSRLDAEHRLPSTLVLSDAVVRHGITSSKPQLLRYLARLRDQRVNQFLYDVATGKISGEADDHSSYRQEPGTRAGAVLALAQAGDQRASTLALAGIKEASVPQDLAAYEISLALLGDPAYLKGEHFQLKSYSLGFAGLDAIEGFNGTEGMTILQQDARKHPWAAVRKEAIKRMERLTAKTQQ